MEETVRYINRDNPVMRPGDVFATNDPYAGGSHLPDITVVSPVHDGAGELLFFTANRAHHAEIGGIVTRLHAAVFEEPGRGRRADPESDNRCGRRIAFRRIADLAHERALSVARRRDQSRRHRRTSRRKSPRSK